MTDDNSADFEALRQMGGAVFTAQMFEALFVLVARSALKCPDAKDFDEIAPFPDKAFKQPVAALVKELGQTGQIDPKLADRINDWVEARHTLVHRLILSKPHMKNADFWQSMKDLSKTVYVTSTELCLELMEVFVSYAERMPQAKSWLIENRESFEAFSKFGKEVRTQVAAGTARHG